MSRRDNRITFQHMLDYIEEGISMADGRTRSELESDRMFFLAMLKLVEIVGEAATRITEAGREAHPDIPWRELVSTRNRLIHGYDTVDKNILWQIVTCDFPPLARRIREILAE